MAEQIGVPFLGRLPIYEPIRVGRRRHPARVAEPQSSAAGAFAAVASQAAAQVSMRAIQGGDRGTRGRSRSRQSARFTVHGSFQRSQLTMLGAVVQRPHRKRSRDGAWHEEQ